MSSTTIEWADVVWNPVTGCRKISAGCANCYAADVARRFWPTQYGQEGSDGKPRPRVFEDVWTHADRLDEPLRWRKPRRVFVNSMSDLFHDDVPDEFIAAVFGVMAAAPRHTFLVLTKRPERMREFFAQNDPISTLKNAARRAGVALPKPDPESIDWTCEPLPNVHLGVSVEDQRAADERIPILLDTPAAVRWISAEPLLGPVQFGVGGEFFDYGRGRDERNEPRIRWVVVGGESGPRARPCDVAWIRSIVEQCRAASVPCFVKQLGKRPVAHAAPLPVEQSADSIARHGEYDPDPWEFSLHDSKGGDPAEWPDDLRIREIPA